MVFQLFPIACRNCTSCVLSVDSRTWLTAFATRIGHDGPWSTFLVGAGTPPQFTNVLISTLTTTPWFVLPQGCTDQDSDGCVQKRGRTFDPSKSSTWNPKGNYSLSVESNLGLEGNGEWGFETVNLGPAGNGLPALSNQLITGVASRDFWIANWGIKPVGTNLSSFNDPVPSWISTLKDNGTIASLSWAYTAGSYALSSFKDPSSGKTTVLPRYFQYRASFK